MAEIRDKVKTQLDNILSVYFEHSIKKLSEPQIPIVLGEEAKEILIKQILSIPELAVVDREIKLERMPDDHYRKGFVLGWNRACALAEKENWVKEVKDV